MTQAQHRPKDSVDSEMHELNLEADLLEQKTSVVPAGANGEDARLRRHHSDPDAQAMVIESLRAQVQDLFSQVSQLNGKLVKSYDRVSDLEDELHVTSQNLRTSTLKVSQLELERSQHLSALSTGLLVEKDHVTTELTRLMEKATEEAARRGQAESARAEIEQELDDLSAGLFNQANIMVAEARIAQARSEQKAQETEEALRSAEEIVGALQAQMQALQAEKERADRCVEEMQSTMGKGKWIDRRVEGRALAKTYRLLSSHAPYQEFIAFVMHLRTIRPTTQQPPAMSTLIQLPFLARLVAEDSDSTVRLDLAPSLNWLTRRSVISAIHGGQLTIEPMSTSTLLEEIAPSAIPDVVHYANIYCALCGATILSPMGHDTSVQNSANGPRPGIYHNSWSSSLLKNPLVQSITTNTKSQTSVPSSPAPIDPPTQVYIFRLDATTSSGLPVALPLTSPQPTTQNRQTIYPLCTSKWCLTRLRTTCSLWAFVRTSVVEKVWEESSYLPPASPTKRDTPNGTGADTDKPAIPPRRSRMGIGALWGSMQRSLSASRQELEAQISKPKETVKDGKPVPPPLPSPSPLRERSKTLLPPPPPRHPSLVGQAPHKLPPSAPNSPPAAPPPLPKRNRDRALPPPLPERAQNSEVPEPPTKEPTVDVTAPPPLSRDESRDSFATPTDEIASFVSLRPDSPHTIPLPDSKPASPEPGHPRTSSEESSNSPAGDTPHPAAAPPPLPRRAAARSRPLSSVVSPDSAAASPSQEVPPPAAANALQVQEDISAGENNVAAEGSSSDAEAQPAETAESQTEHVDVAQSTASEPVQESTAEPPVGSSDEPPVDATPVVHPAPLEESEGEREEAATPDAEHPQETSEEPSEPAGEETQPEGLEATSEDTRTSSPVVSSLDGVRTPSDDEYEHAEVLSDSSNVHVVVSASEDEHEGSGNESEDDDGTYVGDATWEERTWKELVRLREEMFWARIGGVR
ncbi:hypothetical protein CERSUDRAFT_75131 [Gelatoporia subvermispora B]|uniref:GDP/GTP exchange factor Sec2 N-terminal domain-containing protein n=1 Tax=Ceriporiopsis subvermispora (strain B) TaxID=914234 RepID=M2R9W8_CERS8|nr:hypothetical protein CERSUDRAFT_75131 [Gelatoporia subvermispora B]